MDWISVGKSPKLYSRAGGEQHFDDFPIEKQSIFSHPDWGSGDLAIPQHRILYFKFRGHIVWDKRERRDDFFGSTGGRTIREVMLEHPSPPATASGAAGGSNGELNRRRNRLSAGASSRRRACRQLLHKL